MANKVDGLSTTVISTFQSGDTMAFKQVYDLSFEYLFHVILKMVHHREDAQDLAHDVFVKIYEKRAHFNHSCLFSTWLYRIATNHTLNFLTQQQGRRKKESAIYFWNNPSGAGDWEHELDDDGQLSELLMGIKPEYRICLVMHELDDLSYDTIADTLDISLGTVKSRINRAKTQLKDLLAAAKAGQTTPVSG
ncbi:MAG: RNA polymerase sigma factor [bacterium]|nr:RNA polymerase sigma factor [bacterium]